MTAWHASETAGQKVERAFDRLVQKILDEEVPAFLNRENAVEPLDLDTLRDPDSIERLLTHGQISYAPPSYSNMRVDANILVERAGLDAATSSLAHAPAVPAADLDGIDLSDDMRLALAVVKDWGITPGSAHTIEAIAARVKELAKGAGQDISNRRAEEIARIVKGRRS